MPTYQFRCPDGTIIERVFKMGEVPQTIPAPDGSGEAERMISGGAGLIFKGSGFYITDYGKDGKKDQRDASAKAEAKGESKAESKAEAKGESKAESKSESKSESKAESKASSSSETSSGTNSKPDGGSGTSGSASPGPSKA